MADEAAHLDNIVVLEPKNSEGAAEPVFAGEAKAGETAGPGQQFDGEGESQPARVSKEQFFVAIKMMFDMPQVMDKDWQPLAIKPNEEDMAKAFSDGIYGLLEIWFPSMLIIGSPTLANLAMCAPLIMAKVMAFREIVEAKNARRRNGPPPTTEFANDQDTRPTPPCSQNHH
ncbi:MAG: hypothetical protein K8953_05220 [Proteobacteria bacterium]|nr:hypothetical protein [Pseudomonadota bacterium]